VNYRGFKTGYRIVALQALVVIVFAGIVFSLHAFQAAYSVLWGGMICVLANLYFARKLFASTGALAANKILQAFYWGEAVKLTLTLFLFFIGFKFGSVIPLMLLMGYIVAQISFWLASLML
jgi:ATP synthase protein I